MERTSLVGHTLGDRYRVDELIGRGGMSTVYKAYDPNLKRVVAIKAIHAHLADDPKFVARFQEEATAVARLRHTNIVQVFDYSHDGDLYYMVQEFVPGETLHDHLQRLDKAGREIAVVDAIGYGIDICEAAGYAHHRGMIHRDIKPANIMIDVHGRAILMDFGIVKITGSSQHTVAGAVVGTALYMPPELIRGETPDPRSDIYSLGVTLHETLSGRPPFEADSAMTLLMMHLQDPPPNLCHKRSEVPGALCDIIGKAMAKKRDDRYESAAAMGEALRALSAQLEAGPAVHFQATELDVSPGGLPAPDRAKLETPVVGGVVAPTVDETPSRTAGQPVGDARRPVKHEAVAHRMGEPELRSARGGAAEPPAARRRFLRRRGVWAGGLAVVLALVLGLVFFLSQAGDGAGATNGDGNTPAAVAGTDPVSERLTTTVTTEPGAGESVATQPPAATSAPTPSPTAPLAASITGITLDAEQHYVVDFETAGFDPAETGPHVHFFFDGVTPQDAGWPAHGTYLRHTGPTPFAGYTSADRPDNAGQLCIIVASADHVPQPETAACVLLPDVVIASADEPQACRFGPGDEYAAISELGVGASALVRGLSANELWWAVVNPHDRAQGCWLSTLSTTVSGDLSTLPIVQAPPPGSEPQLDSVEIVSVTVDVEGRYVVDFQVTGFEPAYPGTHIHFYFDTFSPADVGIGGEANRRAYGGDPPFTGYGTEERPAEATELCAIVANPEHSVLPESGNCFPLPDLPSIEITSIKVDEDEVYLVDFQVDGFEPAYPGGTHIHFFFNTFSPSDVGMGGEANRRSWGENPPFTGYTRADRPADAARLCAIVANPNHTVILDSGNCFPLPDLPSVELTGITLDDEGSYVVDFVPHEFEPLYPGGTHLHFYFNIFSEEDVGIGGEANRRSFGEGSPFAGYGAVDRPEAATELCATVAFPDHSVVPNSGDCIHLPDVLQVEITGIALDADNRYVVDYVTYGFTSGWPGTHVHFYFSTVTVEELRQEGSTKFSHGGASPYNGYSTADRPADATELCAIVATADNEHLPNSGTCFPLPGVEATDG